MEDYPDELRTPPVSLVSLVGCQDLHTTISTHLHSEQPPINTLALPDFSKILVLAKKQKDIPPGGGAPDGIIKKDWLLKRRTKVPAVVAALFNSDHVSGDPAQWLQVCTDLDNLKNVIRARNIKLVLVVVVPSTLKDKVSEDRMIALRKRAEVDSKYLITLVPDDAVELKNSLSRLANTFAELANAFYRDEGRRVKTRLERKSVSSVELNIRYCFKVAVYAEFRRDWAEALRLYEDAYHALRENNLKPETAVQVVKLFAVEITIQLLEMIGTSTRLPPIQRLVEIKMVAEQLHFKISTLLLHGGKVIEAIKWFRQHIASYRTLEGPPDVIFFHWEWLSRQFLVFAELLESSSATSQSSSSVAGAADRPSDLEFYPAYYYELAACHLKEKRSCLEISLSVSGAAEEDEGSSESVVPSLYVGQFARLLEFGDTLAMHPLKDEEYVHFALSEGKRFQDSVEIIALLQKSFEAYNNVKAQRMGSYCGLQLAKEYFATNEFSNAQQTFDKVASLYRQEGWVTLLWEVLAYLRECSRKLGSVQNFIEYSLEMAALPVLSTAAPQSFKDSGPAGPPCLKQREFIHNEVFEIIREESRTTLNEEDISLKVSGDSPLHLEIDLVSPLRVVLLASAAFHEQIVKPHAPTPITLSLLSQLPYTVQIEQLEIQFNQSECNFIIVNAERPQSAAISNIQPGRRVETAPFLALATNKWLRLTYDVKSEQSGKLECIYVIAKIGPHFSICCRSESPASMNDLPLWKFEDRVEASPTKDPALAFSGQKATQVEEPDPQVDLKLDSAGPALVGENFSVPVTITSKGHFIHSGELKINLVDTRGGGLLSPRDSETSSADNLYVELLGLSGLGSEDESQSTSDSIRKIQHSFGLISVPFLNVGDTWSCNLEIRWHRPKPIMLYVSLGYSPNEGGPKVHVHKSLQIEGKTPLAINHKFMLPCRRDPLLLSKIKPVTDIDQAPLLPANETSILIVGAKNCSEVPLRLLSLSIEPEENAAGSTCKIQHGDKDYSAPALIVPGEEFKKVFSVIPQVKDTSKLKMGSVCLRWGRDFVSSGPTSSEVVTKQRLPDVHVELPPLVVSLECPPHAILGEPFTHFIRIHNQTKLLQEVKFSLADSQSFVLSGPHDDTIFVLPKSVHNLGYKLVPLASGSLQLPRVTLTSVRYSAGFQPSIAAASIFVFPSKPHFKPNYVAELGVKSVTAEQIPA